MSKNRQYKKPAIQEAIFEAKFPYDELDSALPGQIFEKIKQIFPIKKDISYFTLQIGHNTNTQEKAPPMPAVQAWKEDKSELVQFGQGIITANCLKYSSWKNFVPTIQAILDAYIELSKPQNATRIGVRYINTFHFPEEKINIADYFNLGIQTPEKFIDLQGFDLTLVHKPTASPFEVKTKFSTASLRPDETGYKFNLDMDCYTNDTSLIDSKKIISLAENAHEIIGNVFESIITNKTRTLMETE